MKGTREGRSLFPSIFISAPPQFPAGSGQVAKETLLPSSTGTDGPENRNGSSSMGMLHECPSSYLNSLFLYPKKSEKPWSCCCVVRSRVQGSTKTFISWSKTSYGKVKHSRNRKYKLKLCNKLLLRGMSSRPCLLH